MTQWFYWLSLGFNQHIYNIHPLSTKMIDEGDHDSGNSLVDLHQNAIQVCLILFSIFLQAKFTVGRPNMINKVPL